MEGVLSGCYHICPTKVNFQFDTTFMYVISVLLFLKVYQFRWEISKCTEMTKRVCPRLRGLVVKGQVAGAGNLIQAFLVILSVVVEKLVKFCIFNLSKDMETSPPGIPT